MHNVKSEDKILSIENKNLEINFCERMKLITKCFPNQKMKKFITMGYEKMDLKLDLLLNIKEQKKIQKHLE